MKKKVYNNSLLDSEFRRDLYELSDAILRMRRQANEIESYDFKVEFTHLQNTFNEFMNFVNTEYDWD